MPVITADCGCTFDTDFVSTEHRPEGNPYHAKAKGEALPKAEVNEFEAEARKTDPKDWAKEPAAEPEPEPEPEDKPKKKHW